MTDKSQAILLLKETIGKQASTEQRKASNPNKSVWVEASAGTGKTKVLSDRVLRLLLQGVRPEKILCLTYTKAAAVEMSSRIAAKLSRWSVLSEDKLLNELNDILGFLPTERKELEALEAMSRKLFAVLLDTPGGMKIQTIHSFCQEVLARFPLEAKISPYFEVMDDRSSKEALLEIRKDLISYVEKNPNSRTAKAIAFLTNNISEYSFPKIMTMITDDRSKISKMFMKYGDYDKIIAKLRQKLNVFDDLTQEELILDFMNHLNVDNCKKMMEAWFHGGKSNIAIAEKMALVLSEKKTLDSYDVYQNFFLTKGQKRANSGTKEAIKFMSELPEIFDYEAQRVIDLNQKIISHNLFLSTQAILTLAEDLIGGYMYYKKIHSKLDYEDLVVMTRDLLQDNQVADWVLFKLDGGVEHILIDEAQDTSPTQWEIIKSITADFFSGETARKKGRTVFAVGDKKQSIYSFQGADPKEFEKAKEFYKERVENFEEVRLAVSFRSTKTVLELVDHVFSDDAVKKGVVSEGDEISHNPYRLGDAGKIEFWQMPEVEKTEKVDMEWQLPISRVTKESASVILAKQIAHQIKKTIETGEILPSKNRPIRYGDFLVLVQRRNSFVDDLVRECKNIGVNIAGVDKIKLLEQIAIQDLIALAKFVLLPTDDLNLATVLKTPIFGLNDDDLVNLCCNRSSSIWHNLSSDKRYGQIYQDLLSLLGKLDFYRPYEFYSFILNKLDGRKKFIQRMGREVLDGIDEFVNLTLRFERDHIPNLQNFVSWIESSDVEIKREQEQGSLDAVRIMTVHGSKGLQAPIIILPDTVRVINTSKKSEILWDDIFYFPLNSAGYDENCLKVKERDNQLSFDEYRRLLYVALTRAEDRLCVCGYKNDGKAGEESWYSILLRKISELSHDKTDRVIVLETPQEVDVEAKNNEQKAPKKSTGHAWMFQMAQPENPLMRPYAPSKIDGEEDEVYLSPISQDGENRYKRGLLIHKLLEFLPAVSFNQQEKAMMEFLNKNAEDFSAYQKQKIVEEVSLLLKNSDFEMIFGKESSTEVPIMGEVDGKIISAQIDRLVVLKDKVIVVDYKTNRPAAKDLAEVPTQYIKQLKIYERLLQKIYPHKKIETYILWTNIAHLMKIDFK